MTTLAHRGRMLVLRCAPVRESTNTLTRVERRMYMPKMRAVFYVDSDMKNQIEALKQSDFYNKTYSDLYRYLIKEGLKAQKGV